MFLSLSGQTPADKFSTVSLSETHRPVSNMLKLYWLGKLNELFSFFLNKYSYQSTNKEVEVFSFWRCENKVLIDSMQLFVETCNCL